MDPNARNWKTALTTSNPYDRIYSACLYSKRCRHFYFPVFKNDTRTEAFKKPFLNLVKENLENWVIEYRAKAAKQEFLHSIGIHFAPIIVFATLATGKVKYDYVIRQEQLSKDYISMCDDLGIKNSHVHIMGCSTGYMVPKTHEYLKFYDSQAVEIINRIYADEFELFGYDMIDPNSPLLNNSTV